MLTINSDENSQDFKSRHNVLSIYIIFFMLCDLYMIKANLDSNIENDIFLYKHSETINSFLIGLNITDVILSLFLLKWRKWAFWMLVLTSVISVYLNIFLDESILPLVGFFYIIVLFALLHLKKNNISGWSKLR